MHPLGANETQTAPSRGRHHAKPARVLSKRTPVPPGVRSWLADTIACVDHTHHHRPARQYHRPAGHVHHRQPCGFSNSIDAANVCRIW